MQNIQTLYNLFLQNPHISTDTRKISPGSIFFALKGANFNGNTFAQKAIEAGAVAAVIDDVDIPPNPSFILVEDVLTALQALATHHRKQLQIPVLAITGSNGKTTTKELIFSVLSTQYQTSATIGNLNNHIGVPLTLLKITSPTQLAIVEMGANHQQEIKQLAKLALPTHGVITNVGLAHIEGFGGFEGVKKGKKELYDFLELSQGIAFIHADDKHLLEMGKQVKNAIFYSATTLKATLLTSNSYLKIKWGEITIQSNLMGEYNFENVLAAIAIGQHFGINEENIIRGIEEYIPSNHRSQEIKHANYHILADCYNANPTSMQAAIQSFGHQEGYKIGILGDMFELGEFALMEHQRIHDLACASGFNELIFVGKSFNQVQKQKQAKYFNTTADVLDYLKANPPKKQSKILLKGSRSMRLEQVLEVLN